MTGTMEIESKSQNKFKINKENNFFLSLPQMSKKRALLFFFTAEFSHFLMANDWGKNLFPQKFMIKKLLNSATKKALFFSTFLGE
jgi:hypothetical protein